MKLQLLRSFIISVGVLLLVTAAAKFVSAGGSARILQLPDPIFSVTFRLEFISVGVLELVIALICLLGHRLRLQAGLVAWLATGFVIYRFALILSGYRGPCHCLGNLTDALHILPHTADIVMKAILAYLLIGSYVVLFWLWRKNRKVPSSTPSVKLTGSSV